MSPKTSKSFTLNGAKFKYCVTKGDGEPSGGGMVGDLHFDLASGTVWVREDIGWMVGDLSMRPNGLPSQQHPTAGFERRLSVVAEGWMSRNYWYTGGGVEVRLAWLASQAALAPAVPTNGTDVPVPQSTPTQSFIYPQSSHPTSTDNPIDQMPPRLPDNTLGMGDLPPPVGPVQDLLSSYDPLLASSSMLLNPPDGRDMTEATSSFAQASCASTVPIGYTHLPSAFPSSTDGPHLPEAVHPANSWVSSLIREWDSGPPSLVELQQKRGRAILETLLSMETPIERLNAQSTSTPCCEIFRVGTRMGPRPSQLLAMIDLLSAPDISFSDSFNNTVERSVMAAEFWNAQSLLLSGKPFNRGGRLLAAFDIPATESGLLSCQYVPPFEDGKGCSLSHLTNTWTLAGAITHPHSDGIACAMIIVHWRGRKLWLLWPATLLNLRIMQPTLTTTAHLDTTIDIIRHLEGLQVLFLTEEDFFEFTFSLRPNTIHCCLSFTESCHVGMPVRSIRYLDDFELVMGWAHDFLATTLIPDTIICNEEKAQVVDKYEDAVREWEYIHKQPMDRVSKSRIGKVLEGARSLIDSLPTYVRP
ncbi:hypothetical protein MD484_g8054, partial [Candolleomyces efflorescens]